MTIRKNYLFIFVALITQFTAQGVRADGNSSDWVEDSAVISSSEDGREPSSIFKVISCLGAMCAQAIRGNSAKEGLDRNWVRVLTPSAVKKHPETFHGLFSSTHTLSGKAAKQYQGSMRILEQEGISRRNLKKGWDVNVTKFEKTFDSKVKPVLTEMESRGLAKRVRGGEWVVNLKAAKNKEQANHRGEGNLGLQPGVGPRRTEERGTNPVPTFSHPGLQARVDDDPMINTLIWGNPLGARGRASAPDSKTNSHSAFDDMKFDHEHHEDHENQNDHEDHDDGFDFGE